ncbi:transposase [Micromonospora sp. NPDC002717]|uniref:transposase n=1 Tax=Micromonospora sp. NPDC002717 TaxID=3154424 RepID=UPI003320EA0D
MSRCRGQGWPETPVRGLALTPARTTNPGGAGGAGGCGTAAWLRRLYSGVRARPHLTPRDRTPSRLGTLPSRRKPRGSTEHVRTPEEFWCQAVALVLDSDRRIWDVGRELGVNHETLRNRVAQLRQEPVQQGGSWHVIRPDR